MSPFQKVDSLVRLATRHSRGSRWIASRLALRLHNLEWANAEWES
jgi:hypothetical protein